MSAFRRFAVCAAVAAAALEIAAIAWPGAQEWLHRVLVTVAAVALWPLGIVAFALVLAMVMGLISHGHDDGFVAEGVARLGFWASQRWLGFLYRLRHPVAWGIAAGLVAGALIGLGTVAAIRTPRDARTLRALDDEADALEAIYARDSAYPDAIDARDGYDRPLDYQQGGHRLTAHYALRSAGYDGLLDTGDDLCLVRGTRLERKANALVARGLRHFGQGPRGWAPLFDELHASQCPPR